MKTAGLYLRVSTQDQAEKFSLPAQRRILTEHAARQGWRYEVYEDAGVSGETLAARPAMLRLLEDVKLGRLQVALAVELERFSRSQDLFDWLVIRKTFREAGVRWGTPSQLFSPDDPEDAFLSVLFGALSAREKQKFIARSKRGKDQAARGDERRGLPGRYVASWRTYGYSIENGQLVAKEGEVAVVRRIFQLSREGWAIREIARALTREGVPTPRQALGHPVTGRGWAPSSVRSILLNETYSGRWHYARNRTVGGRRTPQPKDEWITVSVPRIVSDEELNIARRRIALNASVAKRNKRYVYLLAGIIFCAECQARLYGKNSGGGPAKRRRYYRCARRCPGSQYVPADAIEHLVWEEVTRALRHPELVLAEAQRQRESKFGKRDEAALRLETVRAALAKIPVERERISLQHQEGYLPWPAAKARLDEIRRRQTDLEDEGSRLEAAVTTVAADREREASLRAILGRFGKRLAGLRPEEKAVVLRGFVQRIAVGPDGTVSLDSYLPAAGRREETFSSSV